MKEISSMDFPQHGEVFYFYGQALPTFNPLIAATSLGVKRFRLLNTMINIKGVL
jgi:hypothetical protein